MVFGLPGGPKIDPHLKDKLLQELPGILNWALEGCRRWLREGLILPDEVKADTKVYQEDSDELGQFVEECLELFPDGSIGQSELYDVYLAWDNSGRPLGKRRFNAKLGRPGITKFKAHGGLRVWKGVAYSATGQEIHERITVQRF